MGKRKIKWVRVIIVSIVLLSLMYLMKPANVGYVVLTNRNETPTYTGQDEGLQVLDPYANITRPGHHNFSVIFDYKIMFMGYDINETLLHPNDIFEITYYWKALDNMDKDYVVFVHFTDEDGRILFQGDYAPEPKTTLWKTGEIYKNVQIHKVPNNLMPQNTYIRLGWWHPPTGKRIDINTKENIVTVGTGRVE
ncbi:MAG: hypothetical protein ABIG84_06180 [archaeon]